MTTSPPRLRPLALAALLLLPACLESEEELRVHDDGSVDVRWRVNGDAADLAAGFPLPLGGPWRTADAGAERWLAEVGPATGGEGVRARARGFTAEPDERVELTVEGSFASVDALPRWTAPEDAPYRSAYLERRTALAVERKGGRTVYVFERTLAAPASAGRRIWHRVGDALPEELEAKLDRIHREQRETPANALTPAEWETVADVVRGEYGGGAEWLAREAVGALYTRGDASLSVERFERVVATTRQAVDARLSTDTIVALHRALLAHAADEREDDGPSPFRTFEDDLRRTLRESLGSSLAAEGLDPRKRNAVLGQLEWHLTALDHATDLGDEELTLRVHLPGRIVAGDYDRLGSDGEAVWTLDGSVLAERDVRLRAVSVLE